MEEIYRNCSKKQADDIKLAIKNKTPIIITGKQGKSGKTYTDNRLRNAGAVVYEEFECLFFRVD